MTEIGDELYAEIPSEWKGLRACLRCSLIKTYTQVNKIIK